MRVPFLDLHAGHREIERELSDSFLGTLRSAQFILTQEVEAFEQEFAAYCGVPHCVGVGNATEALSLILRAMGIGIGAEVIVPGNTCIATWMAVSEAGAIPVPVEPDLATLNIDPGRVEAAISDRTRAVIAVHLYGSPAPMHELAQLASRRGLRLIEDAAQGHGARLGGVRVGALADAAAFSFYPTKNLGALGDGGAVTTADAGLARKIRLLRNYGSITKNVNETTGGNSRLDSIQAGFLRVKLKHLEDWNRARSQIADRYRHGLAGTEFATQKILPHGESANHLFVVRCPDRAAARDWLAREGIETLIHYPLAPHMQEAYAALGLRKGSLPVTERLQEEVLSLPMYPQLSNEAVDHVINACRRIPYSKTR